MTTSEKNANVTTDTIAANAKAIMDIIKNQNDRINMLEQELTQLKYERIRKVSKANDDR